jgi:hypothetical protein
MAHVHFITVGCLDQAQVLKTGAKWYGVTYKEDRQTVVDYINKSIEDGIYPKELWKD